MLGGNSHPLHLSNDLNRFNKEIQIMSFSVKKSYVAPQLTIHGNVEKLTQQNGKTFNDTPLGTPATDNDNGSTFD
jgi:hypothetical protein